MPIDARIAAISTRVVAVGVSPTMPLAWIRAGEAVRCGEYVVSRTPRYGVTCRRGMDGNLPVDGRARTVADAIAAWTK